MGFLDDSKGTLCETFSSVCGSAEQIGAKVDNAADYANNVTQAADNTGNKLASDVAHAVKPMSFLGGVFKR